MEKRVTTFITQELFEKMRTESYEGRRTYRNIIESALRDYFKKKEEYELERERTVSN